MCYYATTDYVCGDWKWGNMMLRCPRQHRIGETCGAKLVHHESVTRSNASCKICEEIHTKQRRLSKTYENIDRWRREPDKFSASLEKAQREASELDSKIKELQLRRPSVATNPSLNGAARGTSGSQYGNGSNMLPPVSSIPASPGYEYASSGASLGRRQDSSSYTTPRNPHVVTVQPSVNLGPTHGHAITNHSTMSVANYGGRTSTIPTAAPGNVAVSRHGIAYSSHQVRR